MSQSMQQNKTPQEGIFKEGSSHFYFLEYDFNSLELSQIKKMISRCVHSSLDVSVVVNFGAKAWRFIQPNWMPKTLTSFETLLGQQGHNAPSTQADLFFWVHGSDISTVFDVAQTIHAQMKSAAGAAVK